tara:strand:+ start:23 stop:880 length:858 start_codon:yes stop_codon:yes gene_type:complete
MRPSSRSDFKTYCLRKLGAPVLEINLATEQCEDLIDDALQMYQERTFDGAANCFLKYKLTQADIDRGTATNQTGTSNTAGITTTSATSTTIAGYGTTTSNWYETSNFLQVPPEVLGVTKIFHYDGSNTITNNMFSVKYQLFLNDVYYWGSTEVLTYAMVKTYLQDIEFLLTTQKQIRFNKRQDRLYLDVDWDALSAGDFLIMDCYRLLDPNDYDRVWNDQFLKLYATALFKRQWGQNLLKFGGVKLPGGIELNGRQIYDDGQRDIDQIMERMSNTYELPPLDMIG